MIRVFLWMGILSIVKTSVNAYATSTQCLPKKVKGVGIYEYLPVCDENSIVDLEVAMPTLGDKDVLIQVKAVSVNPVDILIRSIKDKSDRTPLILGRDGSGIVVDTGALAHSFRIGDEVYFLTDFGKNGTSAQFVATDENSIALKPKLLSFEESAALPLTAMTAYNSIYNELGISENDKGKTLLIINSGGGVGTLASQLAKNLGLRVIGTASRSETESFSRKYGVDVVLNHKLDLIPQLHQQGFCDGVDFILVNYDPVPYWNTVISAVKPSGKICALREAPGVDLNAAFDKNIALSCELSLSQRTSEFSTSDVLRKISNLFDEGKLKHTLSRVISPINAANLREAHQIVEQKRSVGKIVLSGF